MLEGLGKFIAGLLKGLFGDRPKDPKPQKKLDVPDDLWAGEVKIGDAWKPDKPAAPDD